MGYPKLPDGMISGALRPSEKRRIAEVLRSKGAAQGACELCGHTAWTLGDYIVSPQGLARAGSAFRSAPGDPVHPSILLFCSNCGNTKTLNLIILAAFDLFDQDAPNE